MPDRERLSIFTNCHPERIPVFRADRGAWSYFYAPGMPVRVAKKDAAKIVRSLGKKGGGGVADPFERAAAALEGSALRALRQYDSAFHSSFSPECLTVLISRTCPMACSYCFSGSEKRPTAVLDDETFLRAARWLVKNCRRKGKDFVLVIHGGGEPTVHMEKVRRFHCEAQALAREHGVGFFSYIATSGLLSPEDAAWLGRHFSLVGLSCDGPPRYQNRQRPRAGGAGTSDWIERSARIINREGGRLSMRVTVTPSSLDGLESIVRYGKNTLGIVDIRVEPVYRQARGGFSPADSPRFVRAFRRAAKLARDLGVHLDFSGARPREVHGAFCQIFRNVLQLNPDGTLSSCFLAMEEGDPRIIGCSKGRDGGLGIKRNSLRTLAEKLPLSPARCLDCVNRVHCARDCPDQCYLDGREGQSRAGRIAEGGGFRCRVQRALTEQWIFDNAVPLPSAAQGGS